jgi:hypothetical protein
MKGLRSALTGLLLAITVMAAPGCSYNTFVTQDEAIKTQWAQVEN